MKDEYLMIFLLSLVLLGIMTLVVEIVTIENAPSKEVPCYDLKGSIINNTICLSQKECGIISRTILEECKYDK